MRRYATTLVVTLLLVSGFVWANQPKALAVSGSEFRPGRIIDDTIFFNPNLIGGPAEIQAFLNSKVPVCDTWHSSSDPNNQPPFTCLKDYRQNVQAKPLEPGLCAGFTAGNKSAAQIIYEVGQSCGVNPAVLLVMLQKEQALITDTWPWNIQYRSAMGYGCPDTAPCDAEYYGFFNQVYNAARQFRYYAKNPTYYNHRAGRNNNILFSPNGACGSSSVFIENQATAGLYNYTPYQPNQAALNNLYGTGDNCSAYGNRNFWRMFNDWFGSTATTARVITTRYDVSTDNTGEAARIGFSLNQRPAASVTIPLRLSDDSLGGFVSTNLLVIQPENWNRPDLNQAVIYGRNNGVAGAQYYSLITDSPGTVDGQFRLLTGEFIEDVTLTNFDAASPVVYRLYSNSTGFHTYTANISEKSSLVSQGYIDEGPAFSYCKSGEQTVERLVLQNGKPFMTLSGSAELAAAQQFGYQLSAPLFTVSLGGTVPVYRLYNPQTKDHLYTISTGERDFITSTYGYTNEGVAFSTCPANREPVYRMYNPSIGNHFFTTSPAERDTVGGKGYKHEGVAYYVNPSAATLPLYRLYNPARATHFYTVSVSEKDSAAAAGYNFEGTAFTVDPAGTTTIPVFRLFNPVRGSHFFTVSESEKNNAVSAGYSFEGTAFNIKP